jgi:hypothetical protein
MQPDWLYSGARVRVLPSSSTRAELRSETVASVDWPHLVYLDGWPGAVNPARCQPITETTEGP